MGFIQDFIDALRPAVCDGCGQELAACDRQCELARKADVEWWTANR